MAGLRFHWRIHVAVYSANGVQSKLRSGLSIGVRRWLLLPADGYRCPKCVGCAQSSKIALFSGERKTRRPTDADEAEITTAAAPIFPPCACLTISAKRPNIAFTFWTVAEHLTNIYDVINARQCCGSEGKNTPDTAPPTPLRAVRHAAPERLTKR